MKTAVTYLTNDKKATMAELAVGVVGLAALVGTFNDAVDFCEYIELRKDFGSDFITSQIQLKNAGMRLTRWGQAVGLTGEPMDQKTLEGKVSADMRASAEEHLGQVNELIDKARRQSLSYGRGKL